MSIYDNETSKIYPDLNLTTPLQESQAYLLKKLTEIEAYLLDEIESRRRQVKKKEKEINKYGHTHRRHRPNYIISDHWRGLYPSICQQCWPAHWHCLRRVWDSSSPFNDPHTKNFPEPNGEARKTRCYYAACPKQVRQYNRYHFTGNARRGHLPH